MTNYKRPKTQSLSDLKDKYIGQRSTTERETYEYELNAELIGRMIKSTRQKKKLTQSQLGSLVGVQKSHISKLENGANNVTLETICKVFNAMDTEITFSVKV